jgi:hypothetical protein
MIFLRLSTRGGINIAYESPATQSFASLSFVFKDGAASRLAASGFWLVNDLADKQ